MNHIKAAIETLEAIVEDWPQEPEPPKDFAVLAIQKLKEWEISLSLNKRKEDGRGETCDGDTEPASSRGSGT